MASRPLEAGWGGFLHRGAQTYRVHPAVSERVEPVDLERAAQFHERDRLLIARLEPNSGAGWHVEPHAPGHCPLEAQRAVDLEEVKVRADLDGPVSRVRDRQKDGAPARIRLDVAVSEDVFAWDHVRPVIGWDGGLSPASCHRGRCPRPAPPRASPGRRP